MRLTGALFDARYLLGPLLGRGGMADVYRADDLVSGRQVAIKVLRAQQPSDLRRFSTEADVLARLDDPAIVRLLGSGDHDGMPYLVLELVEGQPLAAVLTGGPLPVERVAELGAALARGLAHAHQLGVTHRDVKPGNVLVDADGRPHLADFGIARLVGGEALTTTGQVLGTACYLAPEQVQGREIGPPADVYSLGLVLIEAMTGQRAFDGSGSEAALARLHRDPAVPPHAPPWLAQALAAMTAREPTRRPGAGVVADAFAARSASALGDLTIRNEAAGPDTDVLVAPPLPLRPRGRWLAASVATVGLVAALVLGILLAADGENDPASSVTTTTAITTTTPPTTAAPAPPTTDDDDKEDDEKKDKSEDRGNGDKNDD